MNMFVRSIVLLFSLSVIEAYAASDCPTDLTVFGDFPNVAVAGVANYCIKEPDSYRIKVYKMGLCNGIDPTVHDVITDQPPNPETTSSCVTTFDAGSAGVIINVQNNVSDPISGGTVTKPPNGSYTHGFIVVENGPSIKSTFNYTHSGTPMNCTTQESHVRTPTMQGGDTAITSSPNATHDCSAGTPLTAGWVKVSYATLECQVPSVHCAYEGDPVLDDTYAYLVNEDYTNNWPTNSAGTNTPAKLLGFSKFKIPVVVDDMTTGMEGQFKVGDAMAIMNVNNVGIFKTYPLKFKVITKIIQ